MACMLSRFPCRDPGIGESNRLSISDPDTDILHLFPKDIINATTALHGALTGVEVDALRVRLRKKLSALADFPAHIVMFRGHLARLTTAGQAPLALDAYRLFLASLSSFPVTSTLYCGRWLMGQLHSRRSSATPSTLGASTPTSSPIPPFDPSRAMSKGTKTGRARMMA